MYITSDFRELLAAAVSFTPQEELTLLEAMANGDGGARQELFERKLPVMAGAVWKLEITEVPEEDLMQVGAIGLIKALDQYTPEVEGGVDSLISQKVREEVLDYMERTCPTKCAEEPEKADLQEALEQLNEIERGVITLRMGLGDEPGKTQEETAQLLGISCEQVSKLLRQAQVKLKKHL